MDDLERFERDLDRYADEIGDRAERVVKAATLRTEALGKAFAPVDTGFLKSSHTSDFERHGDTSIGETGPEAGYAGYVHFGTSRQAPNPWLYRAADIVEPQFYAACEALGASVDGSVSRRSGL